MSKKLRDQILLLLEEHARAGSPYFKEDREIAARLEVSVGEVQHQLDILESQGLIRSANSFEGHEARISPEGSLVAERLEGYSTLLTTEEYQADLQSLIQDLIRSTALPEHLAAHLGLSEVSVRALTRASDKDLRHLHPELVRKIIQVANSIGIRSFAQSLELYSRWQPQSKSIFLCHSSSDKPRVREIYQRLLKDGMNPWLDEENLLPGQHWETEIIKALQQSDVIVVMLSHNSVSKTGFVQKEIKLALDASDLRPPETIFLIPARLESCEVPDRLRHLQWVDLFTASGYEKLLTALSKARSELGESMQFSQKSPATDP